MDKFVETFYKGYVACAFWSSTIGDDAGTPLDQDYSPEDLSDCAREALWDDCHEFVTDNWEIFCQYENISGCNARQAGHDFWLTRNGHGAGFWDRGIGDIGDTLTNLSADHGSQDLYIGDDGKIYVY